MPTYNYVHSLLPVYGSKIISYDTNETSVILHAKIPHTYAKKHCTIPPLNHSRNWRPNAT